MSRPIKELLKLMLENEECFKPFQDGLCGWVNILYIRKIIKEEEYTVLRKYMNDNKPSIFSSVERFRNRNSDYWWKMGDIKPRIKWIKKHIKKNS